MEKQEKWNVAIIHPDLGIVLLLSQHTTLLRRIYRWPIDFVEEITTGMVDLILVNSKFTVSTFAKTFKHLDARGIRPVVLYPAANMDQFNRPNAIKLNFLSINQFERKKNTDLAISAFAMLHSLEGNDLDGFNLAGISLTIAGKLYSFHLGPNMGMLHFHTLVALINGSRRMFEYFEELKQLAEREGVCHQVRLITSCPTAERIALLSECVCVLYTPKDEHFGIVPWEAVAAHKPVIACNSGGPVETIEDGLTGFLCELSPQDFCLAVAKLIRDPQLAERLSKEARQHVEDSFSTKIFGQHLNLYVVDMVREKRE